MNGIAFNTIATAWAPQLRHNTRVSTPPRPLCGGCVGPLWSNGERPVELVDLPAFGRTVLLVWHKRR